MTDQIFQDMARIVLNSFAGFIPAVLFYSCIAMAVIRARVRTENTKPAEFYPNRHIYHPQRVFTFFKVVLYVATVIFLCFLLPYILMYILFVFFRAVALPIAGLAFIAGVVVTVKIIRRPDGSVIQSLTVDSSVLTVQYRGGGTETYACRQYAGYNNNGASGTVIVFRDEYGTESALRIGCLTDWDNNMLKSDLERVCQTGNIAEAKKASAGGNAAGSGIQPAQAAQITQAQQAVQNFREEKDALYADPQRYAEYLKEEAQKLSAEQRQDLVSIIMAGEILAAIKRCREWTHLGLKEAKDMVDSYQTCLVDSDVQSMAAITAAAAQPVTPAEIPTVVPDVTSSFMSQMPSVPSSISAFGFDMPGTTQDNNSWTLRITDNEQPVTDARSLERNIDHALSEIGRKNEEFFVLSPAEPVRGLTFMQVCQDKNDVYFHLEAGLTEKNAQGNPKILCKEKLMGWEARNLCISFYRGEEIYTSDWYELK